LLDVSYDCSLNPEPVVKITIVDRRNPQTAASFQKLQNRTGRVLKNIDLKITLGQWLCPISKAKFSTCLYLSADQGEPLFCRIALLEAVSVFKK